jgi:hypothetical protein
VLRSAKRGLPLLAVVALAACGRSGSSTTDGATDGPRDVPTGGDAADAGSDRPADAGSDAPADAPVDAGAGDVAADAPAGTDARDAAGDLSDGPGPNDAASDGAGADAGASCIRDVFGDHLISTAGRVYRTGGDTSTSTWTLITTGGTDGGVGPALDNVVAGIQSQAHACALRSNGTVWCWATSSGGTTSHGELGDGTLVWPAAANVATEVQVQPTGAGPTYLTGIASLMADSENFYGRPTCAIDAGGHLWCWGPIYPNAGGSTLLINTVGTPTSGASPYAVQIAASSTAGDLLTNVTAVSAGDSEICIIRSGIVQCWGVNTYGGLGTATKTGGSVNDASYPVPVAGLPSSPAPTQIAAGNGTACALLGGEAYCWGSSSYGAVGTGNGSSLDCAGIGHSCEPAGTPVATAVGDAGGPALTGIARLYVGYSFGCGITTAGALWCWGDTGAGSALYAEPFPLTAGGSPSNVTAYTSRTSGGFAYQDRFAEADGTYYVGPTNHARISCP